MPRRLTAAPRLPIEEPARRSRAARDPVARTHRQIVWLAASGRGCPAVAALIGDGVDRVRAVRHRDNGGAPPGLGDRRQGNPGAAPLLDAARQAGLRAALALAGPAPAGGLWTRRKAVAWISARAGRPVAEGRGRERPRKPGSSPQRPRPRATAADPAAQAAFEGGPPGGRRRGGACPSGRRRRRLGRGRAPARPLAGGPPGLGAGGRAAGGPGAPPPRAVPRVRLRPPLDRPDPAAPAAHGVGRGLLPGAAGVRAGRGAARTGVRSWPRTGPAGTPPSPSPYPRGPPSPACRHPRPDCGRPSAPGRWWTNRSPTARWPTPPSGPTARPSAAGRCAASVAQSRRAPATTGGPTNAVHHPRNEHPKLV